MSETLNHTSSARAIQCTWIAITTSLLLLKTHVRISKSIKDSCIGRRSVMLLEVMVLLVLVLVLQRSCDW